MKEIIIELLKNGCGFIPQNNKYVLEGYGKDFYSISLDEIEEWIFNGYDIGVILSNKIVVIDIDNHNNENPNLINPLENELGKLPNTYYENTPSKGLHLFFKKDPKIKIIKKYDKNHFEIFGEKGRVTIYGNKEEVGKITSLPQEYINFLKDKEEKLNNVVKTKTTYENKNLEKMYNDSYLLNSDNKFKIISSFAGKCNYYGIGEDECFSFASSKAFFEKENKLKNIVKDIYNKYSNQNNSVEKTEEITNRSKNDSDQVDKNENKINVTDSDFFTPDLTTIMNGGYLSKYILKEHLDNKYIYLQSPTGSGKTRFSLIDLPNMYPDKNILLIMPKVAAVQQKSKQYNIHGIYEGIEVNDSRIQISTYDGLKKYIKHFGYENIENTILVFDEAHLRITADYRKHILRYIAPKLKYFYKTMMLSGTPIYIEEEYKYLCYEYNEKKNIPVKYVYIDKKNIDRDSLILALRNTNLTNVIYINNKNKSEALASTINILGGNAGCFNRDTEETEIHQSIINDCLLPDNLSDIIMTEYGVEALDIYSNNEIGNVIIPDFQMTNPASIGQLVSRFRNQIPKQVIIFLTKKDYDYDFQFNFKKSFDNKSKYYRKISKILMDGIEEDMEYENDLESYKINFPLFNFDNLSSDNYSFDVGADKYAIINQVYSSFCKHMEYKNPKLLSKKLSEYGLNYAGEIGSKSLEKSTRNILKEQKEKIAEINYAKYVEEINNIDRYKIYSTENHKTKDRNLYYTSVLFKYFNCLETAKEIMVKEGYKDKNIEDLVEQIKAQQDKDNYVNDMFYHCFKINHKYIGTKKDLYEIYKQNIKKVAKDENEYKIHLFENDKEFSKRFKTLIECKYITVSKNNTKMKAYSIISHNPLRKWNELAEKRKHKEISA